MDFTQIIENISLAIPGFMLAIVLHEAGHAWMAMRFGDDTAKQMGRLTLNPAVHADIVGTIIFPLIGIAVGGIPFGWAKPVPVDPRRFKKMKEGIFWVSFAGPLANIILAIVSAFLYAFIYTQVPESFGFKGVFIKMTEYSVFINILLAIFNMIPFPPLDGSKMVSAFLNYNQARKYEELQRYSFVFILILWFTPIFSILFRPFMQMGYLLINVFAGVMG